ncbi:hypothetical protein FHS62_001329 [Amphiplicatus metriothermophilus]|nr:hypothetical protein [Amphiplicatus metriothermophilus]MBB5518531.1 hypothetical protein [Amphiplicatus metriothermophilus]
MRAARRRPYGLQPVNDSQRNDERRGQPDRPAQIKAFNVDTVFSCALLDEKPGDEVAAQEEKRGHAEAARHDMAKPCMGQQNDKDRDSPDAVKRRDLLVQGANIPLQ